MISKTMHGDAQWSPKELEKLRDQPFTYGGTSTGRVMGGAGPLHQIPKAPLRIRTAEDDDLLNSLAQPLPSAKAERRRRALQHYISYAARGTERRLSGDSLTAEILLNTAAQYQAQYQFTQEEIDGSST